MADRWSVSKPMGTAQSQSHVFASIAHGFSYTYVIFTIHNYEFDNFMRESMIIVMGGFFGNMIVVGLLTYFAQHSRWLQHQMKKLNESRAGGQ
jgi:preprotein translocase subunit SecG